MAHKNPKTKKITEESDIDQILSEGGWKPVPAARVRELEAMAREGAARRPMGGARPGAGRKFLDHVPTLLNLKKETKQALVKAAGGSRGMGAVVDRLVAKAFRK